MSPHNLLILRDFQQHVEFLNTNIELYSFDILSTLQLGAGKEQEEAIERININDLMREGGKVRKRDKNC